MSNPLRNALAVIAGLVVGSGLNLLLITVSPMVIPPPAGVDVSNAESLGKAMHLFEPRHAGVVFFLGPGGDGVLVVVAEDGVEHFVPSS